MDALVKSGDKQTIIKNGGAGISLFIPFVSPLGCIGWQSYSWTDFNKAKLICEADPDGIIEKWIERMEDMKNKCKGKGKGKGKGK